MKTAAVQMSKGLINADFLRKLFLHRNKLLLLVSAFLLGSSNIANGAFPFGAAFFAAASGVAGGFRLALAAAVLAGSALQGSLELVYINAACMLLFSVFRIPLKESAARFPIKAASLLFLSMLLPQVFLAVLQGFLAYDVMNSVFSSFLSFALFFVFHFSVPLLSGAVKKALYTAEEAISIAITAALVLSGIGPFQLLGFSIRNILCVVLLLLFCMKCGPGVGAAAGVAIGLITSISGETTPAMTGAYALCGLLAGLLGSLGKAGSALGFIMGNMILAAWLNGASESMLHLHEILVAVFLFFLLPGKLILLITGPFKRDLSLFSGRKGYSDRIQEITAKRLERFSKAFLELSRTFGEISGAKMPAERQDINVLFDRVADRICKDCSLCMHCWERNFYDTYQVMFKIVEDLESKGRVEERDIPAYFLDKCARIHDFVNTVNNMYELFRVGVVWKSRLNESRSVLSRQFEGMSRVISGLAGEINAEVCFLSPVEEEIITALNNAGIKATEAMVYKNPWNKYEVGITHDSCGGARKCAAVIDKIVSEAVGRRMVRETEECARGRSGACNLKYTEAENLKLTTGVARLPKFGSEISGDSFSFMNGGNGKYTLALSDGMGTGYGAAAQSRATVDMLEGLLESGFDKDMAVNLINSVLVLKSEEDSSCTIDLSVIDLFNGEVEFIKIGAAPTYIKRPAKVDVIKAASLPAGILPGIDAELAHREVTGGDMLIMVTDGVVDSLSEDEPGEKILMKLIQSIESLNPQHVADTILNEANRCCGGKPCDDLTVLVAKVWEKPS
jgi:stage II sporulation protein E